MGLPLAKRVFIILISQSSLILYIVESYLQNFGEEAYIEQWLIFNLGFYLISAFISILLLKQLPSDNLKIIYGILIILLIIGLLNSENSLYALLVYFKYLLYIHIFLYIASLALNDKYLILSSVVKLSIFTLIFLIIINVLRGKGGLFTLVQIQLPLLILSSYYLFFVQKNKSIVYLATLLFVYLLSYYLAINSDYFRIQYLPMGLVSIVALFSIINYFAKSSLMFWLILIIIVTGFSFSFVFLNDIFYFENRLVSFLERLNIFLLMFYDSIYFIIPQGLGSVEKTFDISLLGLSERNLYPSHSGLASILYELSLSLFFLIYYVLFHEVIKVLKTSSPLHSHHISHIKYIYSKQVGYHHRSLLFIVGFWITHNIFYLKGVVTPAYFSDDGIIIYMTLFLITREILIMKKC
jgi:hypothetical protein